jgi:hypothetical protein
MALEILILEDREADRSPRKQRINDPHRRGPFAR